jgi:uncharacterized protein (TIGR00730 family)
MKLQSILVFCGSKTGNNPIYEATARQVGITFAQRGIHLIYGAGDVGLMGVLADAMLAAGGTVTGIIPYFLRDREGGRSDLTELIQVDGMGERKKIMAKRSDAIITLPGGYGTLDELFEMLTLVQLSKARHPIGILNTDGFFDPLIAQIDRMLEDGFLIQEHRELLLVSDTIEELLLKMEGRRDGKIE